MCAADFNGDTFPDLAVSAWQDNQVNILLNKGDRTGVFGNRTAYQPGFHPFNLPDREDANLSVFDVAGRLVRILLNEQMGAGLNEIFRDGTNSSGQTVASGIYFYRLEAGKFHQTKKMLLLR